MSMEGPTQSSIHELMRLMIEQNRQRDEKINIVLSQLTQEKVVSEIPSTIIPDITKTIPMFDGESGDPELATEWLTVLKTTAKINRWPEPYIFEAARSHLVGPAKNWFLSHQKELSTWEEFSKQFEQMFTANESLAEFWKRMYNRVQQRDETVFSYFHDKMRMCRRLELGEIESKKMLCVGLKSRNLCTIIMSKACQSENELMAELRNFVEVENERLERFGTAPIRTRNTYHPAFERKSNHPPKEKLEPVETSQPGKPKETTIKCFNCQRFGHIARDCPQPRRPFKCTECGAEGHTKKYCRKISQLTASVNFINMLPKKSKYIKKS